MIWNLLTHSTWGGGALCARCTFENWQLDLTNNSLKQIDLAINSLNDKTGKDENRSLWWKFINVIKNHHCTEISKMWWLFFIWWKLIIDSHIFDEHFTNFTNVIIIYLTWIMIELCNEIHHQCKFFTLLKMYHWHCLKSLFLWWKLTKFITLVILHHIIFITLLKWSLLIILKSSA